MVQSTTHPPNLLIVYADQQRYDCLEFTGHPSVMTPHLDRLRSQGMSFTRTFTPIPLCCPARQTLLCGVLPKVHGGLWNYDSQKIPGLSPQLTTWPALLKEQGYNMAYFGKWHVSPDDDPTAFGYDLYQPEYRRHVLELFTALRDRLVIHNTWTTRWLAKG